MAKYVLFVHNDYYRLAPNETKRDHWLTSPDVIAKEVSDANYKRIGVGRVHPTWNHVSQTIVYNNEDIEPETITDPEILKADLKEARDDLIRNFENVAQDHVDSDPEVRDMITFLSNIDENSASPPLEGKSIFEYIYDLPGCPQIYFNEIYY